MHFDVHGGCWRNKSLFNYIHHTIMCFLPHPQDRIWEVRPLCNTIMCFLQHPQDQIWEVRPLCNAVFSDTKHTHKFCNVPTDANCSCIYQVHENSTFSRLTLSEQEYMQDQMMMTCLLCLVAGTYFICCPLMTESLTGVTFDIARFNSVHQLHISSHNIWHLSEFI
jgi:hypothetical protein